MIRSSAVFIIVGALLVAAPAQAQDRRGDVSLQGSVRDLHEFDETEWGLGARLSYRFSRWFAADGEVNVFPADAGSPAFSGSRLEGLAGLRVGPHLGRIGVYLALRGGAVRFSEAPEPFACILIFPPPLECAMAGGETVPSVQASLGFEAFAGRQAGGAGGSRRPAPALSGAGVHPGPRELRGRSLEPQLQGDRVGGHPVLASRG